MTARASAKTQQPRLLTAVIDAFQQPDIRQKLLFTIAMLVIFRFVAHVPVPNVNPAELRRIFETNAILGFLNIFSGGALQNMSVAALGVYPYITASIIMQVMVPVVPRLQALSREGEMGRRQIQIYTHWLTVPLAAVQGYAQLTIVQQAGGVTGVGLTGDRLLPTAATILSMTAGTMFLVWLGELITRHGIGNGISLIIFAGIVAGFPTLVGQQVLGGVGIFGLVFLLVMVVVMILSIVFFQEAQRRIPVQYARSLFRGGRMYRQVGQTHIPLPVNSAGMIPLIFAFSIVIFPSYLGQYLEVAEAGFLSEMGTWLRRAFDPSNFPYWAFSFILVVIFTFFYTTVIFQQQNLAENLQRQGGFIPGIRPGRPTGEYLTRVITRITWAGALFLGIIAVLPFMATWVSDVQALQISSASLIIIVGVVLDTMRQLEAQLLMRQYEGFIH